MADEIISKRNVDQLTTKKKFRIFCGTKNKKQQTKMYNYLLVMAEAMFWCFIILMVLSVDTTDLKYIEWMKSYSNNQQIVSKSRINDVISGKSKSSKLPISMRTLAKDCTLLVKDCTMEKDCTISSSSTTTTTTTATNTTTTTTKRRTATEILSDFGNYANGKRFRLNLEISKLRSSSNGDLRKQSFYNEIRKIYRKF